MNLNKKIFTAEIAGRPIILEVSRIAEQANAAVIGRYGQTVVLATAVMGAADRDIDYLPLTVDYEEKFYAVGKIMGSQYVRREGRASENAVLSGRLIDRTIRPLFNHDIRRDIQTVVTILSLDPAADPNFIALLSASAAIAVSDIPWNGPVAGVTIAQLADGALVVNPSAETLNNGFIFDLFAAGTSDKINMIELEGKEAREQDVAAALERAQQIIAQLIDFQQRVIAAVGRPKAAVALAAPDENLRKAVNQFLTDRLETAVYVKDKMDRVDRISELKQALAEHLSGGAFAGDAAAGAERFFEEAVDALVHKNILQRDLRPDFRRLDEVRDLYAEAGLLERVHGSALFIRGNTQALALTTLGPPDDSQAIQSMEFEGRKHFLLHYNFPPYATGETGFFRGPGRREIGHGALAEKALRNLVPSKDDFPYTIRVVSEVLSSNGSSSMASVCAGCLSLMDAGVPIKKMAAGVAMGLIIGRRKTEDGRRSTEDEEGEEIYKILTDIQGPEDHYGDMDFKAAGTGDGLTAIQMDVKIKGVTPSVIAEVLAQARKARLQILEAMGKTLAQPRSSISSYAPVVYSLKINPERIGMVIGPGGKTINGIIAQTGATGIDVEQSGKVYVYAVSREAAQAALKQVEAITHDYQVGEIIEGTVARILDFGAIVEFGPNMDGMVHISELQSGYVKKVEDVVKLGDRVRAKILRMEEGRIGLTLRDVPQQ